MEKLQGTEKQLAIAKILIENNNVAQKAIDAGYAKSLVYKVDKALKGGWQPDSTVGDNGSKMAP